MFLLNLILKSIRRFNKIIHYLKCLQISLNMIQLNDKKGYVLDTGNNIYVYKGSKISSSEVRNIIDQLADVIYSDNCLINGKSCTSTIENRYSTVYKKKHENLYQFDTGENKSKIYNKEKEFLHKLSEVTGKKVSWKGTSAFVSETIKNKVVLSLMYLTFFHFRTKIIIMYLD